MSLFLISLIVLAYIIVRYSRYRRIVLETQYKLLKLSRQVSDEGIFHSNNETVIELIRIIDSVIYIVPNTNFYLTMHLLRTERIKNSVSVEFNKIFEEFGSDQLFINYISQIRKIIIEHQIKFHAIEIALLSIDPSKILMNQSKNRLVRKKQNPKKKGTPNVAHTRNWIEDLLQNVTSNSIPGVMAYA